MTSTFYFYPTAIYMSDLTRCMSGLSQIFPTKFVACTITAPGKDKPIPGFDAIETKTEGERVVDYTETRKALWKSLKALNPTGSCYGDINFIGTSLEGGKNLSEVYIQIDKDTWNRPYIFQEEPADSTSLENLKDKRTTTDGTNYTEPVANMAPVERASNDSYTFNAIILYYNLYLVDPTGESSGVKPVCTELPMGIYHLGTNKTIKDPWVTRLNMSIGTQDSSASVSPGKASKDVYEKLCTSLKEFSDDFTEIKKAVESPEISKCIGGEIKQELDHFRNDRAVNVPYIKDGYWFVNGRKYGKAVEYTPEMKEDVKGTAEKAAKEYIKEHSNEFKGKPGKPGKDGDDGKPGKNGRDGAGLNLRADHEYTDFDDLKNNQPQDLTPGDAYVIGSDLYVWSSDKTWVKVPNFKGAKGDKGEAGGGVRFRGRVNNTTERDKITDLKPGDFCFVSDNIFIWDGKAWVDGDVLRGPAGKKGDEGAPGKDGKDLTFKSGEFILQPCDEIEICLVYRCQRVEKDSSVLSPIYSCTDGVCKIVDLDEFAASGKWRSILERHNFAGGMKARSAPVMKTMAGGGVHTTNKWQGGDDGSNRYQEWQDEIIARDPDGNIIHPNPGYNFDPDDFVPGTPGEGKPKTIPFSSWTSFIDYDVTTRITNIHDLRDSQGNILSNEFVFKKDGFVHTGVTLPMWGYCGNGGFYGESYGYGKCKSNKNVAENILSDDWRALKNNGVAISIEDFQKKVEAGEIPGVTIDDCRNFIQVRCTTIYPPKFIQAQALNQLMYQKDCVFRFLGFFHSCAGTAGNEAMMYGAPNVDVYVCGYSNKDGVRVRVPGTEHIFPIDSEMRPLKFHSGFEWTQTESRRALFNMTYDPVSRVTMIVPEGLSIHRKDEHGNDQYIATKEEIRKAIDVMNGSVSTGHNQ